jgi:hypothetical protein
MRTDVKEVLKRQHYASLSMLRQAIERCPDEVWTSGDHPRNYWRIVYHAALYAHLYLYENLDSFIAWDKARKECSWLEGDDTPVMEPYNKAEMLEYVDLIVGLVEPRLEALDLNAPHSGYKWYPEVTRLELMILSLRHLHGHIGQLTEILISNNLDVDWLGQPLATE